MLIANDDVYRLNKFIRDLQKDFNKDQILHSLHKTIDEYMAADQDTKDKYTPSIFINDSMMCTQNIRIDVMNDLRINGQIVDIVPIFTILKKLSN